MLQCKWFYWALKKDLDRQLNHVQAPWHDVRVDLGHMPTAGGLPRWNITPGYVLPDAEYTCWHSSENLRCVTHSQYISRFAAGNGCVRPLQKSIPLRVYLRLTIHQPQTKDTRVPLSKYRLAHWAMDTYGIGDHLEAYWSTKKSALLLSGYCYTPPSSSTTAAVCMVAILEHS